MPIHNSDSSIQCVIQSVAWKVLGGVLRVVKRMPRYQEKRVSVTVHQSGVAVTLSIHPVDQLAAEPFPGRFLSDAELHVWRTLERGQWLVGKEIASQCGKRYDDPRFKWMLMNLADRGVLEHDDDGGKGYRRAIAPPPGAASAASAETATG